jgi:succinate-semialdehyde dehydrogenase/glutarate-semialdehyde dehydrogenase
MTYNYPNTQLHIAGKWVSAEGGETIDIINPATEEVIGHVSHARVTDLDAALVSAEDGFRSWKKNFGESKI